MSKRSVPHPLAVLVRCFMAVVLTLGLLVGSLLGTTSSASATTAHVYDTPVPAYDGAAHGLHAHTSPSEPAGWDSGFYGPQGTVANATGPLAVLLLKSVAANTVPGPSTNALGQFTSSAGGESAATIAGRSAHSSYPNTLGWSADDLVQFNQAMPGSNLRPDAINWTQRVVRELKPDRPGAISDGWRQVNRYKEYLEELTGESWTAHVDVYSP